MTCLSDYAIDRLVAGEPRESTAEHVAGCADCAARVAASRAERDAFRRAAAPRRGRRAWVAAPVLVAAVALLVWVRTAPDTTRTKGAAVVEAFVRHDGRVRLARPGEAVTAGDSVQLALSLPEPRHVAVVGLDGAGRTTVYREAAPVEPGVRVTLDFSIVLDETRGRERLFVFVCDRAAPLAGITPPDGCTAHELALEKR